MGIFGNKQLEKENEQLRTRNAYLEQIMSPEAKEADTVRKRLEEYKAQVTAWQRSYDGFVVAVGEKQTEHAALEKEIEEKKNQLVSFEDEILVQEFGLYEPRFTFANSTKYKEGLEFVRNEQKKLIKTFNEIANNTNWTVNNNKAQGTKMVKDIQRLLFRAFNNECDDVVSKVKFSNIEQSVRKIEKSAEIVSRLGSVIGVSIPREYVQLKAKEAYLAFEYAEAKEKEKEELREARAREREEIKVQKEIEAKRKELEVEKSKYQKSLRTIREQLANDPDNIDIKQRIAEMEATLSEVDKAIQDVDYREANKRAGYVYVISNIGSFGENIFKIGMTRRLDPYERVTELSDASVPFNFDVHALIFCDDAPGLESALHREFEENRLNLVNLRREFFVASIEEIKDVIQRNYDKTVDFTDTPDAEQFRVSLKLKEAAKSE